MIPPVKLVRQGELNLDVLALIRANRRTAEENVGDIKAMLAALSVGERRVAVTIGQHGVDVFTAATAMSSPIRRRRRARHTAPFRTAHTSSGTTSTMSWCRRSRFGFAPH